MKVVVLGGGRSSEHEVSLRSAASVAEGLRAAGHETAEVLIDREGRWLLDTEELDLRPGKGLLDADAAFPALHGPGGEDGSVQGLLECLDIPYVGSDVAASANCLDKLIFKRLLAHHEIPQVAFCEAGQDGWQASAAELGETLWVKPARLGSSVGISKVTDHGELEDAVQAARRYDPEVLVEAAAPGLEVECSLLGDGTAAEASVPGEIDAHGDWYDYEAKYSAGGMDLVVPARISEGATARLQKLAVDVFGLLGCSGLGRCDFFVDGEIVLVNEINTMPGFTETSVYSKLWEESGIPYPELVERLVKLGIERHARIRAFEF